MRTVLIILLSVLCLPAFSQENPNEFEYKTEDTTYTMRKYVICFLKKGAVRNQDKAVADSIQKGHLAHMDSLAVKGIISIAGPFDDDGDIRGIVIYNVSDIEEARRYTSYDPAVISGRLEMEFHPWWAARGSKLP